MTSPYLERLLRYLVPYFANVTQDLNEARAEALETLASYGARSRAELLSAMQIIILGFATLETLGEAKAVEMSSSMRLRFLGCANNLNRNGQKTEQTLLKRLSCDPPVPTQQEPVNDLPIAQAEEALQQTQAKIDGYRSRTHVQRPTHNPQPRPPSQSQSDNNKRLWGQAMIDTLAEMGMPVQPVPPAAPTPG